MAGLAAYLLTAALVTVPVLLLAPRGRRPAAVTVLVAAVAIPGAALTGGALTEPTLSAVAAAAVVDVATRARPMVAVAAAMPATVTAAHLAALWSTGQLAWRMSLWAGVVALTSLVGVVLSVLVSSAGPSSLPALPASPRGQSPRLVHVQDGHE